MEQHQVKVALHSYVLFFKILFPVRISAIEKDFKVCV